MGEDEDLNPEAGDDTMLREAMEAMRRGNRSRARDLLTRLLKADQSNVSYWVWLSVAVETQKEALYCLQTALKLDPENTAAKRGLVILGGLPPDDSVPPFALNRRRAWEESLALPQKDGERQRGWASPVVRIFRVLGIAAAAIGLFLAGTYVFTDGGNSQPPFTTATHHPTFTLSLTPSLTPEYRTPTPTFLGPTPLSYFLALQYTPTPRYVLTEHPYLTASSFNAGLRFLDDGQYETARVQFQLVLDSEPEAADAFYYIGETYRLEKNFPKALDSYQQAIQQDPGFAPALLGRALANLGRNPSADIQADLNNAIAIDPLYTEAYLQRGAYLAARGNPEAARRDLETAIELSPGSALAWMYLAEAQFQNGEYAAALESGLKANELDLTLLPVYRTLGQAYSATGQTEQAVSVLHTYSIYAPEDKEALLLLAAVYNGSGEYRAALELMTGVINEDPENPEAYLQRGLAYLNMGSPGLAEEDLRRAVSINPSDFDARLGLARAYFDQGKPGDAYVYVETYAYPLAKTDATKAQVFYWEALFLEAIDKPASAEGAQNNWERLLALPAEAMPEEWRTTAYEHLGIPPTFTPTASRTRTPTVTP